MKPDKPTDAGNQLRRAEGHLPSKAPAAWPSHSIEATPQPLHELPVPQFELEREDEELPTSRAEEALLESKRRYERTANTVPVMLYDSILGPDGTSRFLYVAPQPCRELLELDPEALLADMNLVWDIVHPDDLGRLYQEDLAANREGKVFTSEVRIITHSGSLKWLLVNSKPNPAAPGEPVVWSGYIQDITARKQAEEARLDLERRLEQAKKAESLGRMAAAIAHNFNNQLQAVTGNLELAMNKLPPGTGPIHNLNAAMKAAGRAAEISRLMLGYLGQAPGQREPLDLAGFFHQHLPTLRDGLPEEVTLVADLPSPGPIVKMNAHQVQQVLSNLVTNAWEALGEARGSIHLGVKTVAPAAIPTTHRFPLDWQQQDRPYACLEVADTGCGIGERDMEQLFDPFFTTKFTGRGLGLSLVLGIVRAHLGAVTVESAMGRGSILRVFLPISGEAVSRPQANETQATVRTEGCTVLLVEDEPMVRDMARTMLGELGFAVLEAKDGIEALEVFRRHRDRVRCVLSDLTMPRMDGWETLAALRRLAPGIPVILASGYDQAQVMVGDHPERPQDFLSKPYRLAELGKAVHRALADKPDE
jgi:PAS domain S-box-containing protein